MPKGHVAVWPGRLVDLFDIRPGDIDVWSIAHSLSQQCRYTGHTYRFYSVAEHCVVLSEVVPKHLEKIALLHEAAEVVVTDLSYPVKTRVPGWQEMEDVVLYRILDGFFDEGHVELRRLMAELTPYDRRICVDEMEELLILPEGYDPRVEIGEPLGVEIHGWSPLVARQKFYNRFRELFS